MDRNAVPTRERSGPEAGFKKRKVDVSRCRRNDSLVGGGFLNCLVNSPRQRDVFVGHRFRRPEHWDVRFVEDLPDNASAGEMRGRGSSPTGECLARLSGPHSLILGVERVAVIEDQDRAEMMSLETRHEAIVAAEVVL